MSLGRAGARQRDESLGYSVISDCWLGLCKFTSYVHLIKASSIPGSTLGSLFTLLTEGHGTGSDRTGLESQLLRRLRQEDHV